MSDSKKICVYAICKNEAKFVDKWLNNVSEADYIVVLDTGSTDGTYEMLKADKRVTRVEQKIFNPWRFDTARNESMKLIPEDTDICVCTDFDELFEPGWANKVRSVWQDGVNRVFYTYAWGQTPEGYWHDVFRGDKIHAPKGFSWLYPIHEVLQPSVDQKIADLGRDLMLYHHQDRTKPRKYYLDMLKMAAEERPNDPHIRALYAREYLVGTNADDPKNIQAAVDEYKAILKLPAVNEPVFQLEKLHILIQMALISIAYYKNFDEAMKYSLDFISIDPSYRDPYLVLASVYNAKKLYTLAESCLNAAKAYTYQHYAWIERQNTFLEWMPALESETKFALGKYDEALAACEQALSFKPASQEFLANREIIRQAINTRARLLQGQGN